MRRGAVGFRRSAQMLSKMAPGNAPTRDPCRINKRPLRSPRERKRTEDFVAVRRVGFQHGGTYDGMTDQTCSRCERKKMPRQTSCLPRRPCSGVRTFHRSRLQSYGECGAQLSLLAATLPGNAAWRAVFKYACSVRRRPARRAEPRTSRQRRDVLELRMLCQVDLLLPDQILHVVVGTVLDH